MSGSRKDIGGWKVSNRRSNACKPGCQCKRHSSINNGQFGQREVPWAKGNDTRKKHGWELAHLSSKRMLGKHHSNETKQKIAETLREQHASGSRIISSNFRNKGGYKLSEATKIKMRARIYPLSGQWSICVLTGCKVNFYSPPSRADRKYCSVAHANIARHEQDGRYSEYTGFTFKLRQQVWERDGDHCRICGRDCGEAADRGRRAGIVHHLDYDKASCSLENLVLLCRRCHARHHGTEAWPLFLGFNSQPSVG